MRMSLPCSVASIVLATGAAFAQGEGEFPATLKGHAVLPAQSFVEAPADAPADLKTAGKYTTGRRVDAVGSVMGKSNERPTGVSLPFKGQPLQGHSGIKAMPAYGHCIVLTGIENEYVHFWDPEVYGDQQGAARQMHGERRMSVTWFRDHLSPLPRALLYKPG